MPDYIEISEKEYRRLCEKRNKKAEIEQRKAEKKAESINKREELIQQRMRKIAIEQLIKEGEIEELPDYPDDSVRLR